MRTNLLNKLEKYNQLASVIITKKCSFFIKKVLTNKKYKCKIKQTKVRKTFFCNNKGGVNMRKARNQVIAYTISKNITNEFYISIQNGEVVVQAPWYLERRQIEEQIKEKKQWIINKINEYEISKQKSYIKSKIIKILGEDCKVKVNYKNLKKPVLTVEGKNIKITIPNKYKKMDRDEILRCLVKKLYDVIAKKEIEIIMEKLRHELGFAPEDYKLQRINNKLAKCTEDKVIIINPDIVVYDKQIIEYVVLHEFCHLKYRIHSKGFNQMIEKYMPNYREIMKLINEEY